MVRAFRRAKGAISPAMWKRGLIEDRDQFIPSFSRPHPISYSFFKPTYPTILSTRHRSINDLILASQSLYKTLLCPTVLRAGHFNSTQIAINHAADKNPRPRQEQTDLAALACLCQSKPCCSGEPSARYFGLYPHRQDGKASPAPSLETTWGVSVELIIKSPLFHAPRVRHILACQMLVSRIDNHPFTKFRPPATIAAKLSWEYPSPQQSYNALWRKGWSFPEEHVEPMVVIHNRLNEDAWAEILKWESRTNGGAVEAARLELLE